MKSEEELQWRKEFQTKQLIGDVMGAMLFLFLNNNELSVLKKERTVMPVSDHQEDNILNRIKVINFKPEQAKIE